MIDMLFWWTGCIVWTLIVLLAIVCGLPSGESYKGVTVLSFYDFGPVIWHMTPANHNVFNRLKKCGYHFAHVGGTWYVSLSLPAWLSRLLFKKKAA